MSEDELRLLASTVLNTLFTSGRASPPITSMDLLTKVITSKPPAGLSANSSSNIPRFRLIDLTLFESILENLSQSWEYGSLSLSREGPNNRLCVMDVRLGNASQSLFPGEIPRKRKRVVDEDADSASGGEDADELSSFGDDATMPSTTLGALSKEMREVYSILQKGTARGRLLAEQHQSLNESFEPICAQVTKEECIKSQRLASPSTIPTPCSLIHFRPLIRPHTDPALGHCSYLNTCYSEPTYAQSPSIPPFPSSGNQQNSNQRGAVSLPSGLGAGGRGKEKAPCRYLHYEVDWDGEELSSGSGNGLNGTARGPRSGGGHGYRQTEKEVPKRKPYKLGIGMGPDGKGMKMLPPQWINCDLRRFDYSVLGKFHVIMADPPWDIHMSLPYGTMTDDEMRAMPIPTLQDEGLLFLWVTGRAMEVGRECLRVWGYTRVDEVIWVKTNQLQRVIRTGRTGHWLNHTKEHMLVGVKTHIDPTTGALKFPSWANRGLDTDVIVSEVRETSRKPEEVYGLIERMCPGGRKVEIFGRKHNTRPGWLTLGNQLGPDQIYEEDLAERIRARYPERTIGVPTT